MKKIISAVILWCCVVLSCAAQGVSVKNLDNSKSLAGVCFGDSITHYLMRLSPVNIDKGGKIDARLDTKDYKLLKVGGVAPEEVIISSEGYRINVVSMFFAATHWGRIINNLTKQLGRARYESGAYYWASRNFIYCLNRDNITSVNLIIMSTL